MEIGHAFQKEVLPSLLAEFNQKRGDAEPLSRVVQHGFSGKVENPVT